MNSAPSTIQSGRALRLCLSGAALSIFWGAEVFVIQEMTLVLDTPLPFISTLQRWFFRFSMATLLAFFIVTVFPKAITVSLMLFSSLASVFLYTYFQYFKRPLTAVTMVNQTSEGVEASGSLLALVSPVVVAVLGFALALKLAFVLLRDCRPKSRLPASISGCSIAVLLVFMPFYRPIELDSWRSFSYWGNLYGYSIVWLAELIETDSQSLLDDAVNQKLVTSDLLSPIVPPLGAYKNVVIIQAESLDFESLTATEEGTPVMPFLSSRIADGLLFPIAPVHLSGSADADFVLLTGHMPVGTVAPYLPGFNFDFPLPRMARSVGYHSEVFHGNRGTFFDRRQAFEEMNFDKIFFQTELAEEDLQVSEWGIADHHVFRLVAERISKSDSSGLYFVITLTSHAPWTYTPSVFGESGSPVFDTRGRLLNAMKYLDSALKDFVQRLPNGTLCFVYGDHNSGMQIASPATVDAHHVPLLIFKKGSDCPDLYLNGDVEFSMLDAASFIRSLFRENDLSVGVNSKQN